MSRLVCSCCELSCCRYRRWGRAGCAEMLVSHLCFSRYLPVVPNAWVLQILLLTPVSQAVPVMPVVVTPEPLLASRSIRPLLAGNLAPSAVTPAGPEVAAEYCLPAENPLFSGPMRQFWHYGTDVDCNRFLTDYSRCFGASVVIMRIFPGT